MAPADDQPGPSARTAYSSSSRSSCLLVAISSISSGSASSGASTSSRLNERPVFFSGMGPRGLSSPYFLFFAPPPR
jgi:hypothetical protein